MLLEDTSFALSISPIEPHILSGVAAINLSVMWGTNISILRNPGGGYIPARPPRSTSKRSDSRVNVPTQRIPDFSGPDKNTLR